ncbi:MAG: pilus assembly protein TadG-related protein [Actinomycetota bacterium]|nr:pilus assembly protein TadG-related protein [Actinomycetota bacterium]
MRTQRGQAIVLIAITLAVVVGMAALAIDGSRAYASRRDLQAALDASALAAADKLQQTGSYVAAEQAASTIFGTNLRLYSPPSCSPGYATPGGAPVTVACTYSDGTVLTQVVSAAGAQGSKFSLTATRPLALQFAQILTNGSTPTLGGSASGGVNNLLYSPTVAALDQAGCGGRAGAALTASGTGTLVIRGDVVSNGAISVPGTSRLQVAGDIYSRCQSPVPGLVTTRCYPSQSAAPCTFPDVAGTTMSGHVLADPRYPPPPLAGASQARPGNTAVLAPGVYATDPTFNRNVCYFLSAGVYDWQGGYTNSNAFVSNELKPPDEPNTSNRTQVSANQFWNTGGVNCAGAFMLATKGVPNPILTGSWGIEITSVRTDTYAGVGYLRESAPSSCHQIIVGAGQAIQVQLSNVPGAQSYRVYAAPPPSGCAGPFGLVANTPVTGQQLNNDVSGCPYGSGAGNGHGNGNGDNGANCSLGGQDILLDSTLIGLLFAPNAFAPPGAPGAYPPDGELPPLAANLANQNPDRANPYFGDRANEDVCHRVGGGQMPCPGPITPGAVAFYIPSGACLNQTTAGDVYVFGGYQYNWIVVFEPGNAYPPANACNNILGARSESAFIGLVYTPAANLSVQKSAAFKTDSTGGMIAKTITFTGAMPTILFSPNYAPVPPAARLTG